MVSGIIAIMACWTVTVPACAEKIRLTESFHQYNIKIKTGDKLEITLAGNPTTGYTWEKVEGDNKTLSPQGDYKYTPDSQLVGAGGKFVFTFRGAARGKTKLRVIYHRIFEKNVAPLKSFELMITVE